MVLLLIFLEQNQPKRSKLTVQFSNLGFRLRAPGNLPSNELDEALDTLYNKVSSQLDTSLKQLHAMHSTLTNVSAKSHRACLEEAGQKLREEIRDYFSSENPLKAIEITSSGEVCEEQIAADVRQLVVMYRDNKFNGRAVARIFHGIQSPRYPAVIWGRCRFWRQHLTVDFNIIYQIATQEVQKMR